MVDSNWRALAVALVIGLVLEWGVGAVPEGRLIELVAGAFVVALVADCLVHASRKSLQRYRLRRDYKHAFSDHGHKPVKLV